MNKEPKKSIVLISSCCGRGFQQATKLIKELNANGLIYELVVQPHKRCIQILDKYGYKVEKKVPFIYCDDLCFKAECINDNEFLTKVISDLKKVKKVKKVKNNELVEKNRE